MTRFKSVLPLLCVLLFGGFSPLRFDPSVESLKLLRRDAEWAQASSEGKDLEKILSYWSDDAQVIEPGQPIYKGKAAIRKFVSDSMKIPGFNIHWVSRDPAFSPDGKMAYLPGLSEMTVPDAKGGLVTLHMQGLSIWRLDPDGEWRCVMDIATEAPPA
jgi:ketosteroid isomerase-like protein